MLFSTGIKFTCGLASTFPEKKKEKMEIVAQNKTIFTRKSSEYFPGNITQ